MQRAGRTMVAAVALLLSACTGSQQTAKEEPLPSTTTTELTTTTTVSTTTTTMPTTTTRRPSTTAASCHPSYQGACLPPNASDVDCPGGRGDGPVYAPSRRFRVVGADVYGLDADSNGVACE